LKRSISHLFYLFPLLTMLWLQTNCSGLMAPGGNATKQEGGGPGGALDDIAKSQLSGGPGAPPGGGGIFGGSGTDGSGGGLPGGGFPGSTSGTGDGTTVASNTPPGTGQSEHPEGQPFGYFTISAKLFADPDQGGGDCNKLRGEPTQEKVCPMIGNLSGGNYDSLCREVTVPGAIDPNLIPKVEFKADHPFYTGNNDIYQKTISAQCSPDGNWVASTGKLQVMFDPYPSEQSFNTFIFQVDAQYPKDGVWQSRGTKTVTMKCAWDTNANVQCAESTQLIRNYDIQQVQGEKQILSR